MSRCANKYPDVKAFGFRASWYVRVGQAFLFCQIHDGPWNNCRRLVPASFNVFAQNSSVTIHHWDQFSELVTRSRLGLVKSEMQHTLEPRMLDRNIQIDETHSRAICREIGERLRISLSQRTSKLPESMRRQLNRLRELDEGVSPSIVPSMNDR
jgi:hypothetical protein